MSKKESDAVAYYDAHMDDDDLWEIVDPPSTGRRRGGLTATITVRFAPEDAEAIQARAKGTGESYSDIVRHAVRAYTKSDGADVRNPPQTGFIALVDGVQRRTPSHENIHRSDESATVAMDVAAG